VTTAIGRPASSPSIHCQPGIAGRCSAIRPRRPIDPASRTHPSAPAPAHLAPVLHRLVVQLLHHLAVLAVVEAGLLEPLPRLKLSKRSVCTQHAARACDVLRPCHWHDASEIDGPVWSVSDRVTARALDRVAQIADRKYCRPHAPSASDWPTSHCWCSSSRSCFSAGRRDHRRMVRFRRQQTQPTVDRHLFLIFVAQREIAHADEHPR
jgi:hypothetical protein